MKFDSPQRPLRSRHYSNVVGDKLSDEKILKYCLEGYYGEAKRDWAKRVMARRKEVKAIRKQLAPPKKKSVSLSEKDALQVLQDHLDAILVSSSKS